jgi:hypothetical protein
MNIITFAPARGDAATIVTPSTLVNPPDFGESLALLMSVRAGYAFRALLGQAKENTMMLNQLLFMTNRVSIYCFTLPHLYKSPFTISNLLKISVFILTLGNLKTAVTVWDLSALAT